MWQILNKPQYFFKPSLLFYRLRATPKTLHTFETAKLPWGDEIRVRPSELIGQALYRSGYFDLIVSEIIWRLLDRGDSCIDVGANIGYITSLMATKVGKTGKVTGFEPNPSTFEDLAHNVQLWTTSADVAAIDIYQLAVSNQSGTALFNVGSDRAISALISADSDAQERQSGIEVSLIPLDEIFDENANISLLKIDVEGHELSVLEGAANLLATGKLKHIIFEDFGQYPTPTMEFLTAKGYSLFSMGRNFWQPVLFPANEPRGRQPWDPPSYLATLEPKDAIARMKNKGWQVLSSSAR
jgi:FkbM family methyltransferase